MLVLTSRDFLLSGDFRKLTPIFSFVLIILIIHRLAVLSNYRQKLYVNICLAGFRFFTTPTRIDSRDSPVGVGGAEL